MTIIRETFIFYALLPYVCFPFCGCFRQASFITRDKKSGLVALDRRLSYTVMTEWEFAWADSASVILDK